MALTGAREPDDVGQKQPVVMERLANSGRNIFIASDWSLSDGCFGRRPKSGAGG